MPFDRFDFLAVTCAAAALFSVPECGDAILNRELEDALWQVVFTAAPHNAASSSRAPSVEREDQRSRRALRPEPNDVTKWRARTSTADARWGLAVLAARADLNRGSDDR